MQAALRIKCELGCFSMRIILTTFNYSNSICLVTWLKLEAHSPKEHSKGTYQDPPPTNCGLTGI